MGLFSESPCGARVARATGVADLAAAYHLVHDIFVEQGYIHPMEGRLRLRAHEASPDTATFTGRSGGEIVGVQSLIVDSYDLGLPSDMAFGQEIDELRARGLHICEVSNQAISPEHRKTGLLTELMRCCYAHALSVGCDTLLATVSPGHAHFYELLGFEAISPVRSYSTTVDDPTVVVSLDIANRFIGVTGDDDTLDSFLYRYYELDNPYCQDVETWQMISEYMFSDLAILHDLFATRSGLLDRCTADELDAISRRWGPDVYGQIATMHAA